ncbi:MAG: hypothetical protein RL154_289, partial [Pseudomonadota bacterium]
MRIAIDLQGAQSESRFRGIGRYTLALAQHIAKHSKEHEIVIILNGEFFNTIQPIQDAFKGLLPKEAIKIFDIVAPVYGYSNDNLWRIAVSQSLREAFIESLDVDILFIPSVFEGYGDHTVTSIKDFSNILTVATLHDLIPLARQEHYLKDEQARKWYFRKLEQFKKADYYFSDSEYSKKEAGDLLNISPEFITTIYPAIDDSFYKINITTEIKEVICNQYGIKESFILYVPGGFDERKNLDNVIIAYSQLPEKLKSEYELVIAGKDYGLAAKLNELATTLNVQQNIKLIGYVKDDDLMCLYSMCKLFIFASLHEGFGMPPLEALACGASVLASNTTSLPEVVGLDEALFDPLSAESISTKIELALTDEIFYLKLKEHSLKQKAKFSWDDSAELAIKLFEQLFQKKQAKQNTFIQKQNLALFTPLPPIKSGIADYSKQLLPALLEFYNIFIICEQDIIDDNIAAQYNIQTTQWFEENISSIDRIVYQIGNSDYHGYMLKYLKQYSGVVVLHDLFLGNTIRYLESIGQKGLYNYTLYKSHGFSALLQEQEVTSDNFKTNYPMSLQIFEESKGILSHSDFLKKEAQNNYTLINTIIKTIHFPKDELNINKAQAKNKLGFQNETFLICSFGILSPNKHVNEIIDAFLMSSLSYNPNVYLIFVGSVYRKDFYTNLNKPILESGIQDRIIITDFVNENTYKNYLGAADLAIQLRTRSRGESSAAVFDCLASKIPLITNNHGPIKELPDNIFCKLADKFSSIDLKNAIENLFYNEDIRNDYIAKTQQYIKIHATNLVAKEYFEAIEKSYSVNNIDIKQKLIDTISTINCTHSCLEKDIVESSKTIYHNQSNTKIKQLLIDVSGIVHEDLRTGIQRVVRAILLHLLQNTPSGYRIEPICDISGNYKYARKYTLGLIGQENCLIDDDIVTIERGDIFLGLDFFSLGILKNEELLNKWYTKGVK